MSTGLDTLITLVQQRVEDLRVPIFLVVFQIGAVTLAILAGVGSLVLSRQSFELAVLRSRGFSSGKLLAAQGVQALFTAIVAYPLGLLLGMALATLASNANGPSLPGVLFPVGLSDVRARRSARSGRSSGRSRCCCSRCRTCGGRSWRSGACSRARTAR